MTFVSRLRGLKNSLVRPSDPIVFQRRRRVDRALRFVRSCVVCSTMLPPIDFLCPSCWRALGQIMNRGPALKQSDYPISTYSLLTWTPVTEKFVRPLIYAFKGGHAVLASEKLATLFLSESVFGNTQTRSPMSLDAVLIPAPSRSFDHSSLWTQALAAQTRWPVKSCLHDKSARDERQKELRSGERGLRRFAVQEHFAKAELEQLASRRIVFADDVVTSGSKAMAAYMALGDPLRFEVWSLVARPRLAAKPGAC